MTEGITDARHALSPWKGSETEKYIRSGIRLGHDTLGGVMFNFFRRQPITPTVKIREVTVERTISTVVVTGSAVRGGTDPRDVDVFCARFGATEEAVVRAWMLGRGLDVELPLDVHQGPVPVPFGTKPALVVLHQGVEEVHHWVVNNLASALRGEALAPGAFAAWRAQAAGVKIHLGSSMGVYPQHPSEEDPMEGVTALQNAMRHCPGGEKLIRSLPFGDRIMEAVNDGPVRLSVPDNRGWWATPAPSLRITFDEGPKWEVR